MSIQTDQNFHSQVSQDISVTSVTAIRMSIAIAIARAAHFSIPRDHAFDGTLLVHLAQQNTLVELLLTWWDINSRVLREEVHWLQPHLDNLARHDLVRNISNVFVVK